MKVLGVNCWSCRNVSRVTGVGFYLLCSHISRPCPRPADWQTQEVSSTNQLINTNPTKLLCVSLCVFVPVLLTLWVIYLCARCFWAQKALELVSACHTRRFGAFSVHPRKEKHTFEFLHLILTNKHEKLAPAYRDAQVQTMNLDKSWSDLCKHRLKDQRHIGRCNLSDLRNSSWFSAATLPRCSVQSGEGPMSYF